MKKIYKYPIPESQYDLCSLKMPACAEILDAQWQDRRLVFWVLVDTTEDDLRPVVRKFCVFGTGHPVPNNIKYVGTAQTGSGLVWHLFEVTKHE